MTSWYDPLRHHRRSIRLKGYDYTRPGAYFVTICTHDRICLFGDVVNGRMELNEYGQIVREEWFRSAEIRREIELYPDEFVVMPNHLHGIVWIVPVGAMGPSPQPERPESTRPHGPAPRSLASFVGGFKSAVTRQINLRRGTPGARVWQRNYYEHIIRNGRALNAIRRYIRYNPLRWEMDQNHPGRGPLRKIQHS